MDTKLTLSIRKDVIDRAKTYAKSQGESLSQMVETYFMVIGEKSKKPARSSLVRELTGIIPKHLNLNKRQLKKEYTDYLWKKYQ